MASERTYIWQADDILLPAHFPDALEIHLVIRKTDHAIHIRRDKITRMHGMKSECPAVQIMHVEVVRKFHSLILVPCDKAVEIYGVSHIGKCPSKPHILCIIKNAMALICHPQCDNLYFHPILLSFPVSCFPSAVPAWCLCTVFSRIYIILW